jgi:GDP-D-mannose 3', 5'-epimerase
MENVAVTGGAGYLGSHIVTRLLERGLRVTAIDDLSAGSLQNLRDLGVTQDCVVGDLENYEFALDSLAGADTVFHFAAEVGSVAYLHGSAASELACMQSNLVIDANVFKACLATGVKRILYASSASVYPRDEQQGTLIEFREEDTERKVNPEGGYGWSKWIGEQQLGLMAPEVSCGIARIFHSYGENIYLDEDKSQVIASLVRKAVRYPEEDFVIWGDGSQRRTFVFIQDTLDAIFRLEEFLEDTGGSLVVNVGSTEEITVADLARLVISISEKAIAPRFDLARPTGVLKRVPNLDRIGETLGWRPRVDLCTGLERTYRWAEARLTKGR